jgi:nucleoside-diphosphate-sugar epimerase
MRVLVTGAGGFVGRALCPALAAAGHEVIAGVREGGAPHGAHAHRTLGDLAEEHALDAAVAEVDAVVHLAARVHMMRETAADPLLLYRRVNVDGTRRLAAAAVRSGVRRFVLLSSIKVNGERTTARPFAEVDAPAPADAYGLSKQEAEEVLATVAAGTGMSAVALRTPLVYGPGVRANFLALLRLCDSPWPLPFGGVRTNHRSLIGLGNLVDAIAAAVAHPAANGVYLVRDAEDLSTEALIRRLRHALGRPARLLPVPAALLAMSLRLLGRGALADRLCCSLAVDSGRIARDLGWQPPHTVDEELAATVAWYRQAGRRT